MERESSQDGGYAALLLFLFVSGAFLLLLYDEAAAQWLPLGTDLPLYAFAVLLAADAAFAVSPTAALLRPVTTPVFGAAAALEGKAVLSLLAAASPEARLRLLIAFTAVSLHFLCCSWGLESARRLRRLLLKQGGFSGKYLAVSYAMMLLGFSAAGLLMRYILIT